MEKQDLQVIQKRIGYNFRNAALLIQAFVRKSYTQEHGGENNEVLEQIGDRGLDMSVERALVCNYGSVSGETGEFCCELSEGELTDLKALLVRRETLSARIDELDFARFLIMGHGDTLLDVQNAASVKEDLFEAIIGAVAIDSSWDWNAIDRCVKTMLVLPRTLTAAKHMALKKKKPIRVAIANPNKDEAINQLETLYRRGYFALPVYEFTKKVECGRDKWNVVCSIKEYRQKFGAEDFSKTEAKKTAAFAMLKFVLNSGANDFR